MSQNPFEALGAGGFDMNALLQQAQQMQEQMVSAQQELADATVEGTVADGLVSVTLDGTGDLTSVRIRKDSFDPADPEDLEVQKRGLELVRSRMQEAADRMYAARKYPLIG